MKNRKLILALVASLVGVVCLAETSKIVGTKKYLSLDISELNDSFTWTNTFRTFQGNIKGVVFSWPTSGTRTATVSVVRSGTINTNIIRSLDGTGVTLSATDFGFLVLQDDVILVTTSDTNATGLLSLTIEKE